MKEIKNGKFLTWTGLNNQKLIKHIPISIETALGNLDMDQKNLQLTKQVKYELEIEENILFPVMNTEKTHEVCATIIPFNTKR